MSGTIMAFLIGEREDALGRTHEGFVDPGWSMGDLWDSRNDVAPLFRFNEGEDMDVSYITELLDSLLRDWTHEGCSARASAAIKDEDCGLDFMYRVHFIRKFYGSNGYEEECYNPFERSQ